MLKNCDTSYSLKTVKKNIKRNSDRKVTDKELDKT